MSKAFWYGPAGTGKTTAALSQLSDWLDAGVDPAQILVLVPQRALGLPYQTLLSDSGHENTQAVQVVTYGGLAQRQITLYWPYVAQQTLEAWDGRDPTYLTIEATQYYMARFVEPYISQGYFDSLKVDRARIIAQIIDNLSTAAVNGFTLQDVHDRLVQSWQGHSSRLTVYAAAHEIAETFQAYCLTHSLLDFSLQIRLFREVLLSHDAYRATLHDSFRYLIVDNSEENFPVTLGLVASLLSSVHEALILYDLDAGYRLFLGATPETAYELRRACDEHPIDTQMIGVSDAMHDLQELAYKLLRTSNTPSEVMIQPAYHLMHNTFYPQMLDNVVSEVIRLIHEESVSPGQIVIMAPYLGDALRFTLLTQFDNAGIPYVSHRPSRAIRDEPVARAVLTALKLAYGYNQFPPRDDIAQMFVQLIGLDPVRSELLAQIVYRPNRDDFLGLFEDVNASMQARITFLGGEQYSALRQWIISFRDEAGNIPPDHCLSRLFDFVSQPGYGLHANLESGRIVGELVSSAYKFREVLALAAETDWREVTAEYISLVGDGVLAAVHQANWQDAHQNAVFIAPAYTFLMRNRFVDYQFWVDVGSTAWHERLEQPLTHPYVLRRDYVANRPWTDEDELRAQDEMLTRVVLGLLRRCRQRVYWAFTDLSEQGYEQRGPLLNLFNQIMNYAKIS